MSLHEPPQVRHETMDFLHPMEWVRKFLSGIWSRASALRRGQARSGKLTLWKPPSKKVISIGNLEAGGLGKTPLTIALAREAIRQGKTVAVLSRGYRSSWESRGGLLIAGEKRPSSFVCGDEAALIFDRAPGVHVAVGKNRKRSFDALMKHLGTVDLVILDDGFQSHRIHRDSDWILLSARREGQGWFRDHFDQLKYANVVFYTQGTELPEGAKKEILTYGVRSVEMVPHFSGISVGHSTPIVAVCGIARPERFFVSLQKLGFRSVREKTYPDHHRYTGAEIESWIQWAKSHRAHLITTAKDAIKWKDLGFQSGLDFSVLELSLSLVQGEKSDILDELVKGFFES
ncbi:MAG: tetraacyldisaccharide 4'-kinase [Bdellovibrionales bacterium]|nr:tetraacyldisaccharide 4'-kinase [Bdellovibrionales bacterium]